MKNAPIGVFDSGVGGLSVLREIRSILPHEDILYVADSAHAPYGNLSTDFILQRCQSITTFFIDQGVKAVVVACNTATASAVQALRAQNPIIFVAMEPALKPAVGKTRSGTIAILATQRTLASESFARLAEKYGSEVHVLLQACPGFVEAVENGDLEGPKTTALVEHYILPLLTRGADTFVLGCTHYPFLSRLIQSICGNHACVIDPSPAVARELHRRLAAAELLSTVTKQGTERFWTSGSPQRVGPVITQLWGNTVGVEELPVTYCQRQISETGTTATTAAQDITPTSKGR